MDFNVVLYLCDSVLERPVPKELPELPKLEPPGLLDTNCWPRPPVKLMP